MIAQARQPTARPHAAPPQSAVVQRHFGGVSRAWGRRYDTAPTRMSDLNLLLRREAARDLLRPLLISDGRPARLLDVGCGAGNLFDGLPRTARLHGVDITPEMIEEARRRHPGGRFKVADAARLPFDSASMDVVTCLGVLEYLDDAPAALRAMHRVLSPGGHLIASFPNRASLLRRLSSVESFAERQAVKAVHMFRGCNGSSEPLRPPYRHRQWSFHEAQRVLSDAGFAATDAAFVTFGLWGRLGRLRPSLALSAWMTRRMGNSSRLGRPLASTIVLLAQRADHRVED